MSAPRYPISRDDRRMGELGSKVLGFAAIIGVSALAVSLVLGALSEEGWERFFRAYLMAFMVAISLCLGALFFIMLQHAVRAGWSVVLRRLAEGVASNLMWIWILFIPIAVAMYTGHLYEWTRIEEIDPHAAADAKYKFYLAPIPWLIRAVVFFGIWATLARFYVSQSVAQDATGDLKHTRRMERYAPLGIILYGLSQSFAVMDWVMSLEPAWFSTMFPVYFFAASCCGYFSLQILIMFFMQRNGRLLGEITVEHYQDAGKMLFAFGIVFWAYIAYSQYMLIWYADLPEETPWYMARQMGGWGAISLLLLFGHFTGPFVALISRHPKRIKGMLALGAGWMLLVHVVDVYWLTMPRVPDAIHYSAEHKMSYSQLAAAVADPDGEAAQQLQQQIPDLKKPDFDVGYGWHLLDLTCLVGLTGVLAAGTAWRLGGCSLIPERDPRLHESLAFENI